MVVAREARKELGLWELPVVLRRHRVQHELHVVPIDERPVRWAARWLSSSS